MVDCVGRVFILFLANVWHGKARPISFYTPISWNNLHAYNLGAILVVSKKEQTPMKKQGLALLVGFGYHLLHKLLSYSVGIPLGLRAHLRRESSLTLMRSLFFSHFLLQ